MAADSRAVKMVAALLECFFITESANLKKKVDRIPCAALLATSKQVTTECPLNTLGIHPSLPPFQLLYTPTPNKPMRLNTAPQKYEKNICRLTLVSKFFFIVTSLNTLANDGNDMNIRVYIIAIGDIAASSWSAMCHLLYGGGEARATPSGPGGAPSVATVLPAPPPKLSFIWFTVTPSTSSANASHCMTLNRLRVIVLRSTAIMSTFRLASMRTVVGEK
mmetsp:Transcript_5150/g.22999  ORF Transcript_5150/g.22999 Transcript_5150/m.22999 type:complete len:220 (-) Transcript_5150:578-1237(-)